MKNLKKVILPIALILTGLLSFAQERESVTLVSSINFSESTEVYVDLQGTVKVESWDEDYIRIVLEIKTQGTAKETIKYLISQGRYKISSYKTNLNSLELTSPNSVLPVSINGSEFSEDLNYQIFVPRNTLITINEALEL